MATLTLPGPNKVLYDHFYEEWSLIYNEVPLVRLGVWHWVSPKVSSSVVRIRCLVPLTFFSDDYLLSGTLDALYLTSTHAKLGSGLPFVPVLVMSYVKVRPILWTPFRCLRWHPPLLTVSPLMDGYQLRCSTGVPVELGKELDKGVHHSHVAPTGTSVFQFYNESDVIGYDHYSE